MRMPLIWETPPAGMRSFSRLLPLLTTPPAIWQRLWGGVGEKELNRGFNLATSAQRQPGSSIKPLTVYAPAIDMGLISPITVISDYPYQVLGGSAWR